MVLPDLPETTQKYTPVAIPVHEGVSIHRHEDSPSSEAFLEVVAPATLSEVCLFISAYTVA